MVFDPVRRLRGVAAALLCLFLAACQGVQFRYPKPEPAPKPREIIQALDRKAQTKEVDVVSIDLLQPGVYAEDASVGALRSGAAAGCPSLRHRLTRAGAQSRVEATQTLGVQFVVRGAVIDASAQDVAQAAPVPVELLVTHPLTVDPVTGKRSRQERKTLLGCLGEPAFAGWTFGSDWERVDGVWTFELKWRGKTLATQVFELSGGRGPLSGKVRPSSPPVASSVATATSAPPQPAPPPARAARLAPQEAAPSLPPAPKAEPVPKAPAPKASGPKAPVQEAPWLVQAAACLQEDNARHDVAVLRAKGYNAGVRVWTDQQGRTWRLVIIGGYATRGQAEAAAASFKRKERRPALVREANE